MSPPIFLDFVNCFQQISKFNLLTSYVAVYHYIDFVFTTSAFKQFLFLTQDLVEDVEKLQLSLSQTESSIQYLPQQGFTEMLSALDVSFYLTLLYG